MLIAVAAAALVGGLAAVRTLRSSGAAAARARRLSDPLAPEIVDIVRQARDGVAQDPRDGVRWGRFGMVCEANGLAGAARRRATRTPRRSRARTRSGGFTWPSVEFTPRANVDDAVRDMRRAIDVNPTYAPAYWRLGLWLLDQNQTEDAERAFSRATEIDPADRAGWIGLARVYLQRDENARAAGLLERLVASAPAEAVHAAAARHGLPPARPR